MRKPFFLIKNDLENETGAKHYGWKNPSEMFCAYIVDIVVMLLARPL